MRRKSKSLRKSSKPIYKVYWRSKPYKNGSYSESTMYTRKPENYRHVSRKTEAHEMGLRTKKITKVRKPTKWQKFMASVQD